MEPRIAKLLEELYLIDPTLRQHEAKLADLLRRLASERPSLAVTEEFAADLRARLLAKAECISPDAIQKPFRPIFRLPAFPRHLNLFQRRRGPALRAGGLAFGGLAVLFFIVLVLPKTSPNNQRTGGQLAQKDSNASAPASALGLTGSATEPETFTFGAAQTSSAGLGGDSDVAVSGRNAPASAPSARKTATFLNPAAGAVLNVIAGDSFSLVLDSNCCSFAATGSRWKAEFDAAALSLQSSSYEPFPDETQSLGMGGQEIFSFKMLKPGITKLKMTYSRPGDAGPMSQVNDYVISGK